MSTVSKNQIPCAIIGLGRIASFLEDDLYREKPCTHAGAIVHHPLTYICGGFDVNPKRRDVFEKKWQSSVYATLEKLLQESKPAIVHIATPPQTHLFYLDACLEHGVPIIICEKPLAYDLPAAEKILDKITSATSKIIVNHERRFALDYNHVKKVIQSNRYGKLLSIHARLYLGKQRLLRDMLWDDGTHLIDIMHFLTDENFAVKSVAGRGKSRGTNLWVHGKLGSVEVMFECGGGRDHLVFELDLSFESGRIKIGNGLYKEFQSDVSIYYGGMRSLREVSFTRFPTTRYFLGMMEEAVKAYTDITYMPRSSVGDAFAVMKVITTILSLT